MPSTAEPLDEVAVPAPLLLVDSSRAGVTVAVHDASRLGWQVAVPLPDAGRSPYWFELELEVPAHLVGMLDPWAALQSYGRLDGADDGDSSGARSPEGFRRSVVAISARLARARDGFVRHCTLLRSSTSLDEGHCRSLTLWVAAASAELSGAREGLLSGAPRSDGALADEFLSLQLWTVLTDCGRALVDTRWALEERGLSETPSLDLIEAALATSLKDELAYRRRAGFTLAEPANLAQLERLLARTRWLKRHFERVLFLDIESYQVVSRLSGWFSAVTAMLAYLWFLLWQVTLERHPVAIGSGVVAFALITAIAYASRERLKEVGRDWLAGRVQRMFAQRVTHYRVPSRGKAIAPVVSTRESFSQSSSQRTDPDHPDYGVTQDVTVLRFVHRGLVCAPPTSEGVSERQVRLIYRLDLSTLFPRLHDAVRGFASLDRRTGKLSIVDVPRNYEIPIRARLHREGIHLDSAYTLILNKNGLLRTETEDS
ncbi:MAG TPA: hypothetical protein VK762_08885 [Polyangiaceae bacterium]|nr:hypothetical protein [Polyangiaceae bacterium]